MSSTRRQDPENRQFRQDAFASSPDFERGVLGNLVAARCQKLSDPEAVTTLWWLQQVSWRDGGVEKFAEAFLAKNAHLVGTASMHSFGRKPGQIYNAEQVRAVREEMRPSANYRRDYLLRGEIDQTLYGDMDTAEEARELSKHYPTSYPVEKFLEDCELEPEKLAEQLKRFLVDPQTEPARGLLNMPGLWAALREWREAERKSAADRIVDTTVTRIVTDELDFALEARTFVLIEGREGIGKSEAARNWCDRNPGRAVYVRLESGTDETTLYRSIARAIGTSCSYGRKALEMRARIQDALQPGQILLVLDEAHFLWPQSGRAERAAPKRVDWLRTALIDFDVPVALISTPQYFAQACDRFRKGGWNSLQVQRRLARTTALPEPDAISVEDVLAVARSYFPAVDKRTLKLIAAVAIGTVGFLANIKFLRKRVDFMADRKPGISEADLVAEELRCAGLRTPEGPASSPPQAELKPALRRPQDPLSTSLPSPRANPGRLIIEPEPSTV